MRPNAFIQTFAPAVFGVGLMVSGLVTFIRMGADQRQLEDRLHRIETGQVQPDALIVTGKYVDAGRGARPHVVFSGNRQPTVNLAVTPDFFNSVNPGETISGYYFPDGYFIPRNRGGDAGAGRWFFLGLGVLLGTGALIVAFVTARKRPPAFDLEEVRRAMRDRMSGP
jgi:hypothetical protein